MPSVAVLPTEVADQIAAGEVVERPASAVKELIENSLDAGATAVDIDVSDGGRSTIRVSDDGCGMDRADTLLSLQRHATSKIRRAEDLVGVRSFGFRGEALPAIASVSRLTLETAPGDGQGTSITMEGGSVSHVGEVARRRGTTVIVARLFYNVPARLKFMRGTRSEWRAVTEAVTSIALARRLVHLTLSHDGKPALSLAPAATLRERVGALWGAPYAESLLEVSDGHGAVRVEGLVERPSDVGTRSRRVHIAVNGRAVRDPGLVRAAEAAYRSTIPAGLRPALFLELALPSDAVDVNVHPAKAEIRFRERWPVERAVEGAVRRALGAPASAASVGPRVWTGVRGAGLAADPGGMEGGSAGWTAGSALPGTDVDLLRTTKPGPGELWSTALERSNGSAAVVALAGDEATSGSALAGRSPVDQPTDGVVVPSLMQLRRTYLVFERPEGLVLIDQHSAHERVLYERFVGALEEGSVPAQHLLFPLTIHLGTAAADAFESHRDLFARFGYQIEAFGGQTLVVHGVPAPHARFDAERCLRDTLDALTGDRLPGTAARHERLAATIACKAAIKAGDELSTAEMRSLFLALARTTLPAHDVHGRATVVSLSWDEVDRRFGRR